jgi:hypothetical protein
MNIPNMGPNSEKVAAFLEWVAGMPSQAIDAVVNAPPPRKTDAGMVGLSRLRKGAVPASYLNALAVPIETTFFPINESHAWQRSIAHPSDFRALLSETCLAIAVREKLGVEAFDALTAPFRAAGYDFDAPVVADG